MSRIVLMPHGTAGDVLPYIWLGRKLLERGHQVTMIWVESFKEAAEKAGIEYVPMVNAGFDELLRKPELWQPHKGLQAGFEYAGDCMGKCLDAFTRYVAQAGLPHLLIAPLMNFAARLLREKHSLPLVSVVLYPMAFVSAYDISRGMLCWRWLRMLPVFVRRVLLSSVRPYDRFAIAQVREQCLAHQVTPPQSVQRDWWLSPDGTLALFPQWYARPRPDWPETSFQWDFPLEDLAAEKPLAPELSAFLDAGEKPLVFTPGTGNHHAQAFFATAAELCSRLGCRAVFVTRDHSQIPSSLPASILAVKYAPFGPLLERARLCVHHGGIGTVAQCFKAAVPQFIVYMGFDQPDNAERLEKLAAGRGLDLKRFTVENALPLLRDCLESESIRQGAEACRRRLMEERPAESLLMDWLEGRMRTNAAA